MPVPETPKAVRRNFDQVIDRLNSRWDLGLPRLHGRVAVLAENEEVVPRRITSRIRFLCFRPQLNLERLLDDFEDWAKQIKSDWVFKPRQDAGTLPHLPNDKSKLYEASLAKPLRLTSAQRKHLLHYLDKLLDDEYQLSHDSAAYQRSFGETPYQGSESVAGASARSPTIPVNTEFTTPVNSPDRVLNPAKSQTRDEVSTQQNRKRSPASEELQACTPSYPLVDASILTYFRNWNRQPNVGPLRKDRLRLKDGLHLKQNPPRRRRPSSCQSKQS